MSEREPALETAILAIPPEPADCAPPLPLYLATLRYRPPPTRGDLHIIRSEEYARPSPFDGWDGVALGRVTRVIIPGSHLSIVRTPEGVGRVADVFDRDLRGYRRALSGWHGDQPAHH